MNCAECGCCIANSEDTCPACGWKRPAPRVRGYRRDEDYRKYYDRGMTDAQIAEAMGVTKSMAQKWRTRYNLPVHPAPRRHRKEKTTDPMEKCKGCRYWRQLGTALGIKCCHYLLDEGHSRGCPPGKGCKKYRKMEGTIPQSLRDSSLYTREPKRKGDFAT